MELDYLIGILKNLAQENKKGYPFSACIEYRGKFYYAVNEVISKRDPTAHAEIQAIRLACKKEKTFNLNGAKIYCSGSPCPMCLTAIAWAEIKEVYYIDPYYIALANNFYYDRPSEDINEFLNLKRIIKQIK
jgi:tRNA(Arg) A34 adenosine deaminase TadA